MKQNYNQVITFCRFWVNYIES